MNFAAIILGGLVIVLLYVLYVMYSETSALVEKVDLKENRPEIAYSTLPSPLTTRYAYGVWIFVNSWSSLKEKNIFSRTTGGKPDIRLFLDKDAPRMKCDIRTEGDAIETITLTDNFPIQKWVFVVVSLDGQIADMYVDGKLVVSKKLAKMPVISESGIKLGGDEALDIILSKFSRWTKPMDPKTAWSKYMDGNGISSGLPDYGMKLTLLKDGADQKQLKLF